MKTLLMKLWVKSKTHKLAKKIFKNNIIKGGLLLIIASFLIFLTYEENIQDRDKELLSFIESTDKIFEYVNVKDIIKILDNNNGVILFINDRKDINKFLDLLYDKEKDIPIYVCNVKNDELVLGLDQSKNVIVKQRASLNYKKLIERLGSYTENYFIKDENDVIETDYKRIITPMVMFVKNGNILFSHYIIDEEELTDDELLDIYSKGFELVEN